MVVAGTIELFLLPPGFFPSLVPDGSRNEEGDEEEGNAELAPGRQAADPSRVAVGHLLGADAPDDGFELHAQSNDAFATGDAPFGTGRGAVPGNAVGHPGSNRGKDGRRSLGRRQGVGVVLGNDVALHGEAVSTEAAGGGAHIDEIGIARAHAEDTLAAVGDEALVGKVGDGPVDGAVQDGRGIRRIEAILELHLVVQRNIDYGPDLGLAVVRRCGGR